MSNIPASTVSSPVVSHLRSNAPPSNHRWGGIQCSLPATRTISNMDFDTTEACNLACTYCYKWQKKTNHMGVLTAKSAIDWLLAASGNVQSLTVNFMGGEPLLRFDFIKEIVPYGKCRARQLGKSIHFTATTNTTLATDEVVAFFRQYSMSFHCSVDGIPEVHNKNRPMLNGAPSSPLVEKNVPKILAYQPLVCARATVTPRSAAVLMENVKYLVNLGFRVMTFKPAADCGWRAQDFQILREQYEQVANYYIDSLVAEKPLEISEFDKTVGLMHSKQSGPIGCGAGRGLVMVDHNGEIWPCHRYGAHMCGGQLRLGAFGAPFNDRLRNVFANARLAEDYNPECERCPAHLFCTNWCTAESLDTMNNMYTPHPDYCEFNKVLYDVVANFHNHLRSRHPKIFAKLLKEN